MNKFRLIFILIFAFAINLTADLNKSPNDKRTYDIFTLKNGIEVVTVSDPDLATSAATLSVGVGQFQDPEDAQGIAHFLEHMIFMGSEKYKKPNEYMQFISENGGSTNAFTATEQTTYLFSINSSMFSEALDRLSAAIKAPLFDPSMVEKEISAVNSEWLLARQTQQFVTQRVAVNTSNPEHPKKQLGVGNNETLSRDKETLLKSLRSFYDEYYSANLMKLVLVGNESPRQLKAYAKKYFDGIKNKKVKRPITSIAAYREQDLLKNIYVKTKSGTPTLSLEFPLQNNRDKWKSKPNSYVSKLLNSQEENTLFSLLTDEGYIEGGSASINPNVWGADGAAFIDFVLTKKGEQNKKLIIDLTFKYIDLISLDGINKKYFDEMKAINERQFNDYTPPEALSLAVSFGSNIFDRPLENLIDYSYVTEQFDEEAIKNVISQLQPSNLRIYHLSPTEEADIELKYADGSYRIEPIDLNNFTNDESIPFAIKLPEAEILSFDDSSETIIVSNEFDVPKIIYEAQGVQVYLSQSKNHKNNKGAMQLKLMSPMTDQTPKASAEQSIILYQFFKKNRRLLQKAYTGAGISIIPNPDEYGNLGFIFLGRSLKQHQYAEDFVNAFLSFDIKDWELENAVKTIKESLEDLDEDSIVDQLFMYNDQVNKTSRWTKDQVIEAMDNLTVADLNKAHKNFIGSSFLDVYAYGNYQPNNIVEFAKKSRLSMGETSQNDHWRYRPSFEAKAGTARMKKVTIAKDGVGVLDNYIYPEKSKKVAVQLQILNKLFRPTFFNDLRTNQEVGYVASSFVSETNEYPTLSTIVVSDSNNAKQLKEKVMGFNYGFATAFQNLSNKTIQNVKKAMIEELEKKPENLFVEAEPYFDDWTDGNYSFDSVEKTIEYIESTNKDDLLVLMNKMFLEGQYMNTTIQIRGDDFKDTPFFNW